jgi:hypothetical protein
VLIFCFFKRLQQVFNTFALQESQSRLGFVFKEASCAGCLLHPPSATLVVTKCFFGSAFKVKMFLVLEQLSSNKTQQQCSFVHGAFKQCSPAFSA